MSKAVLISIQPKWCELIASGKKTVEVRKTKPNMDVPFKCYIYCTKAKKVLLDVVKEGDRTYGGETYHGETQFIKSEEGSVCDMWGKRQKVMVSLSVISLFLLLMTTEFTMQQNNAVVLI